MRDRIHDEVHLTAGCPDSLGSIEVEEPQPRIALVAASAAENHMPGRGERAGDEGPQDALSPDDENAAAHARLRGGSHFPICSARRKRDGAEKHRNGDIQVAATTCLAARSWPGARLCSVILCDPLCSLWVNQPEALPRFGRFGRLLALEPGRPLLAAGSEAFDQVVGDESDRGVQRLEVERLVK